MKKSLQPTVYIVDDEEDFVDAISLLLRTTSLPHFGFTDPRAFLKTIHPDAPGCILLDVRMPGISGLELQDELIRRHCLQPVIFLTGHGDIPMAVKATRAGAFEFLEKPVKDTHLLSAVRAAMERDEKQRIKLASRGILSSKVGGLTPRESQIGSLLKEGLTSTQMAERLGLSVRTVEMHRLRMMRRLGVNNTAKAVKLLSESTPALKVGPVR